MAQAQRKEIPEKDKWNVSAMYPDLEAWKQDYQRVCSSSNLESFLQYKGKLGSSSQTLKKALDAYFDISRHLEKIYTYAHLRHDEDVAETDTRKTYEEAVNAYHHFREKSAFLEPELLKMSPEAFQAMLHHKELGEYKLFLERIYLFKAHTLSEQEESLLSMAGKSLSGAQKIFSSFLNADTKFPSVKDKEGKSYELSHGTYALYLRSPDRTLRKNAFETLHRHFLSYENTLCDMLSAHVESHVFSARARHFKSALEAALFPNQIDIDVYKNLIQSVKKRASSLHRYAEIRKRHLGLSVLEPYDLYVPMVQDVEFHIPYEKAEKMVVDAAQFLGADYAHTLAKGLLEQRWVDRYENLRKRSGAYSSGCYDSMPYILMNYQNTLSDAKTLCHEAGHSMHSLLSRSHQSYPYADYSIFVAEVASTFQEEVMFRDLISKTGDPKKKAYLYNQMFEDIRATLFRQTMFAEFELKIHEYVESGIPLTPQLLKHDYAELYKQYYGHHLHVGEELSMEWARIPHFYSNFYVYQYATGISAAISLVNRCDTHKELAKQDYLSFLKSGSSKYPLELLKQAGVDMTEAKPIFDAIDYFDHLLESFEKACKQGG